MRCLCLAVCLLIATTVSAAEIIPGPVEARVLRVIDGDSFVAEVHIWPGHTVTVSVRIRGIDAPELRGRCDAERAAARNARAALETLLASGPVVLTNVGGGKYYGRVLADVTAHDGKAVGQAMIAQAHARPYDGGKRAGYCA